MATDFFHNFVFSVYTWTNKDFSDEWSVIKWVEWYQCVVEKKTPLFCLIIFVERACAHTSALIHVFAFDQTWSIHWVKCFILCLCSVLNTWFSMKMKIVQENLKQQPTNGKNKKKKKKKTEKKIKTTKKNKGNCTKKRTYCVYCTGSNKRLSISIRSHVPLWN